MNSIDTEHIPFSKYGSILALTKAHGEKELILHDALRPLGSSSAMRIFVTSPDIELIKINHDDKDIPCYDFEVETTPSLMKISNSNGYAELCFTGDDRLNIRSHGLTFSLFVLSVYAYGIAHENGYTAMLCDVHRVATVDVIKGNIAAEGTFDEEKEMCLNVKVTPDSNGESEFEIQMAFHDGRTGKYVPPEKAEAETRKEWEKFLSAMPDVSEEYRDYAEIAWYNMWSSYVHKGKNYPTDTMLMSKKTMTSVWSWDHCFNALSMAYADKQKAFDQFFAPFYHQTQNGYIPDMWKAEGEMYWGVTKPPIHGWAFGKLMDRFNFDSDTLTKAYTALSKWTDWWMNYRDDNKNGIPAYPMGCDSGWDNATVFDVDFYIETPDLPAYLFLQMKTLARISEKLGKNEQQSYWNKRAEKLLSDMMNTLWNGEKFVSRRERNGSETGNGYCLMNKMALVLGEYLPKDKAEKTVELLKKENLTEHGLATESPMSEKYEDDGYWRGPIWAPTTLLLVDGLDRMGQKELAKNIAKRFCDMCKFSAKGFYENFDALTGKGWRAPGYTWTSSVFFILLKEYL